MATRVGFGPQSITGHRFPGKAWHHHKAGPMTTREKPHKRNGVAFRLPTTFCNALVNSLLVFQLAGTPHSF
jgi:hypothetical protein